ncbi:MAG: GTPase [Candidatus Promineifilaceae bacterium]|nr:GTPase [Candidatus Promineifilaceae bacterium]
MPTNLPAEYYQVEERFKAAESPQEKVRLLEELISTVPKHKGTDKLRADLRRRLSKLRDAAQTKKAASRHTSAYSIEREGAGQVALVGAPNVGKSALLATLTNAEPEVANFPFTTWTPLPGMMDYEDIQIQLIDTPPLNDQYVEPAMMDLLRRVDLILVVVDIQGFPIEQLQSSFDLMAEHRILPFERKAKLAASEQRGLTFKPTLIVVNKVDDEAFKADYDVLQELLEMEQALIPTSAATGTNLDALRRLLFEQLDLIRVYSKPPGEEPDYSQPFVLRQGSTVELLAGKVHRDFVAELKSARVWGSGVFEGQTVSRDHVLQDGDVVELRI